MTDRAWDLEEWKRQYDIQQRRACEAERDLAECKEKLESESHKVALAMDREQEYDVQISRLKRELTECREECDMLAQAVADLQAEERFLRREWDAAEAQRNIVFDWVNDVRGVSILSGRGLSPLSTAEEIQAALAEIEENADAALEGHGLKLLEAAEQRINDMDGWTAFDDDVTQAEVEALHRIGKEHDAALEQARRETMLELNQQWRDHTDVLLEQARVEGYQQGQDDYHANVVTPASNAWADGFAAGEKQARAEERQKTMVELNAQWRDHTDVLLEQAAGGSAARAVIHCANLHTGFDADVAGLVDEMHELIDALNGEHEHTPQNELVQIGAYAINLLRKMGDVPSLEWIESEAERHKESR